MKKNKSILIIAFLLVLLPFTLQARDLQLGEVEQEIMCTCSCSMVLESCQCGTAEKMRVNIQQMIDSGMSKQAILAAYVQQYGEKILAAPRKQGFNLTAWILPFAVPLVVGFVLIQALQRWSWKPKKNEASGSTTANSSYYEMLQKELEEFEEGEEA